MSYTSRLHQIAAALGRKAELTEEEVADRVTERARDRVPKRTRALHNAIHKEPADGGGFYVLAGDDDVFYGHIVELGSVHTAAQPFLIPATEETKSEIDSIGRDNFGDL